MVLVKTTYSNAVALTESHINHPNATVVLEGIPARTGMDTNHAHVDNQEAI